MDSFRQETMILQLILFLFFTKRYLSRKTRVFLGRRVIVTKIIAVFVRSIHSTSRAKYLT